MARDSKVKVRIEAEDRASDKLRKVETRFQKFGRIARTAVLGASAAIAGFALALGKAVGAAQRQEDAVRKLDAALTGLGSSAETVSRQLQAQAAALQQQTRFGDEAIIQAQAYLATLGVTAEQLPKATQATVDLAAALGISLESAARNVGRTVGGFAGELGEVIPELNSLGKEALQAGEGIDLLAQKFSGRAQADAKTFSGAIAQVSNAFGDVLEAFGEFVTESEGVVSVLNTLTRVAGEAAEGIRGLRDAQAQLAERTDDTKLNAVAVADSFERSTLSVQGFSAVLGITTEELKRYLAEAKKVKAANDAQVDSVEGLTSALDGQANAYANAVDSAREFGEVTSVQLEGKILDIVQALRNQKIILGENSDEYQRLAEVAEGEIATLERRIESLRRGQGDLTESVRDTSESYRDLGRELERVTTATNRFTQSTQQNTEAQQRNQQVAQTRSGGGVPNVAGGTSSILGVGLGGEQLFPGLSGGTFTTIRRASVQPNGRTVIN